MKRLSILILAVIAIAVITTAAAVVILTQNAPGISIQGVIITSLCTTLISPNATAPTGINAIIFQCPSGAAAFSSSGGTVSACVNPVSNGCSSAPAGNYTSLSYLAHGSHCAPGLGTAVTTSPVNIPSGTYDYCASYHNALPNGSLPSWTIQWNQ